MTTTAPPEPVTAETEASPTFYVTGGTLGAGAASYVERRADRDLLGGLTAGDYCYVLNSRQMGKSSLCVRTIGRLKEKGRRTCFLDLTKFGGRNLSAEQWYAALLSEAGRALGLRAEMLAYWKSNADLAPMQRLFGAIQTVALTADASPLTVFVDEIDVTRGLPFSADEFFAGIRQCYVGRATDSDLNRLTFCLLGTATPADLIQDTRTSPFNIGRRIEVRDFTPEEAAPLAQGLGAGGEALLSRVLYWTGGHPYLTQRLCRAAQEGGAKTPADVDTLCSDLFLTRTAAEADDNLAFVRNRLLKSEADLAGLLDLYGQMRRGRRVPDDEADPLCAVMKLSGVARTEGGALKVRNRIYEHVFSREWIAEHTPGAELRRQREAYRRGLIRAGAVAAAVLLVMALLVAVAVLSAGHTRRALALAKRDEAARTVAQHDAEQNARRSAALAASNARLAAQRADALTDAYKQNKVARINAVMAQRQQENAQRSAAEAGRQKQIAQHNLIVAQVQTSKVRVAKGVAVQQEALAQARLSRIYVAEASRLMDAGDHGEALAPLVEAMHLDAGDSARLAQHRHLIASALALAPRLDRVWFGNGPLTWASLSPDGRRAAAAGEDGRAHVWDVATGGEMPLPMAHRGPITDAAFSQDGRRLVTCGLDGCARVWDLAARRLLWALHPPQPPKLRLQVAHVSWSRDGRLLAATFDDAVTVWDVPGPEAPPHTPRIVLSDPSGSRARYSRAAFSPDDTTLALIAPNYVGMLIPLAGGMDGAVRRIGSPTFGTCYVGAHVAYSRDGRRLLVAGAFGPRAENRGTLVYDTSPTAIGRPATGQGQVMLPQGQRARYAVFSPDEGRIATASDDGTARVWDAADGRPVTPPLRHERPVVHIEFSRDGRRVVTASDDGTARVWDAADGRPVCAPLHHAGALMTAQFTADGGHVFTAGQDGTARLWTLPPATPTPALSVDNVRAEQVLAGGARVAVLTDRLRVHDLGPRPAPSRVPVGWARWAYPDSDGGRFMLVRDRETGPFQVWDTWRETPLSPPLRADRAWLSPDGQALLLWDKAGAAHLVAPATGRALLPPLRAVPGDALRGPGFSPDGRAFLLLTGPRRLSLLDSRTGRPRLAPPAHAVARAGVGVLAGRPLPLYPDGRGRGAGVGRRHRCPRLRPRRAGLGFPASEEGCLRAPVQPGWALRDQPGRLVRLAVAARRGGAAASGASGPARTPIHR